MSGADGVHLPHKHGDDEFDNADKEGALTALRNVSHMRGY